jgi:hypothetical protein
MGLPRIPPGQSRLHITCSCSLPLKITFHPTQLTMLSHG